MSFPLSYTGHINKRINNPEKVARQFKRLIIDDFEVAKSSGVIEFMSSFENTISFSVASFTKRFFVNPVKLFSLYTYSKHYRQAIFAFNVMSSGTIIVELEPNLISCKYHLKFTELFNWALFMFIASSFFGAFALAWERRLEVYLVGLAILLFMVFGLYFGNGALTSIIRFRKYLKKRLAQASMNIDLNIDNKKQIYSSK